MMDQLSLVPYEGAGGGGDGGGKYKECMRNHAAAMGGQAFDGCGEYMPSSPDSLKCAACGCHRSFHRRAAGSSSSCGGGGGAAPFFFRPPVPALPAPPQPHYHHHHQAALQAFLPSVPAAGVAPHLALPYHAVPNAAAAPWLARSGSETPPRPDDFGVGVAGLGLVGGSGGGSGSFGRKRFRTKFTPEQKERMREFAEKQGWRIQRNDDGELERFCDEIGVKRQVLKVWMHNHKNQLASTSPTSAVGMNPAAAGIGINPTAAGIGTGAGVAGDGDGDDDDTDDSPPRAAVSSPSPSPISV
ncbi:hypothetical protein SEVIR_7G109900v4 [Setaria viridis]|uniref:ZF-HD dimerization-type domain-containing protein n=2 Tax=Setaria TaxID=4554 RepID=A0A368RTW7_SETIT|nr:zinc-finger homeodomain protein 8-like [Setaria italica]XP_034602397.1 zinc-finger homeodomain protein 8-like [Setaria viridis]RCV33687.1 hypothetical protein SETIT_7G102000v2 [Setaria italica]TKW04452.1 hypothetical protein SEVIR_7G109900v2 [Setaria viridis]